RRSGRRTPPPCRRRPAARAAGSARTLPAPAPPAHDRARARWAWGRPGGILPQPPLDSPPAADRTWRRHAASLRCLRAIPVSGTGRAAPAPRRAATAVGRADVLGGGDRAAVRAAHRPL